MNFLECYLVPKALEIKEGYEINDNIITANISKENIRELINLYINKLDEPCFFFLELPLNMKEEKKLRKKESDPYHKAVYYIDGCSKVDLLLIMEQSGEILLNGGLSSFGFASHNNQEEIIITKYNIVHILSSNLFANEELLYKLKISKTDNLVTAWNTFTNDCPGEARIITVKGKDVYSLLKDYKKWGIYQAEVRED